MTAGLDGRANFDCGCPFTGDFGREGALLEAFLPVDLTAIAGLVFCVITVGFTR